MQICLEHIQDFIRELAEKKPEITEEPAVVFMGDFNSTPGSGVYTLAVNGQLGLEHEDAKPVPDKHTTDVSGITVPVQSFDHELNLASAYSAVNGSEPKGTNFHGSFAETLDYIFYQPGKLDAVSVLELPSEEECRVETALPNTNQPSDHVAIAAKFAFK